MSSTRSTAFDLLDRRVQKWIWDQGWERLHDVQERAARPILAADTDVVLAAATAGGKTEAAFLPIASVLASTDREDRHVGLDVLYVSPLKALINDQHERLTGLFSELHVPVHRWHGDVPSSRKRRVVDDPEGVLLITPESLEALFIRRGSRTRYIFGTLRYVVVDELHAFIGSERGRQLQSLLHRVELAARRRIPRIALSATLGDMDLACGFLRPSNAQAVHRIVSTARGTEVRLQVRGYAARPPRLTRDEVERAEGEGRGLPLAEVAGGDAVDIARHLFVTLRGGRHIAFTNRRADVEQFTDLLREFSDREHVPNEFWPHHGSLDRTLREDAEEALMRGSRPATILATTTLELGIDIGQVESIAQIGPPSSVASMRQRLGRSGRRGQPAVLRVYVQEREVSPETAPQDQLRASLTQAVAMVRLLVGGWCEPPLPTALHLSTLVQQTLSLLAQHGSVHADQAFSALCRNGPFRAVGPEQFTRLLRDLGDHELIKQTHTGELVLDLAGERLVNHYEFYAAFSSPEEYRIVRGSQTLGSLPVLFPLFPDATLIFAGRRWKVVHVDDRKKLIEVTPAAGGRPPVFGGQGALLHRRVRQEMRRVLAGRGVPPFLDAGGRALLAEGRQAFRRFSLGERSLLRWGRDTLLFPWTGDREMATLMLQLRARGLDAAQEGLALLVANLEPPELLDHLRSLAEEDSGDSERLATVAQNKLTEKHHVYLSEELLDADYASSRLDAPGAVEALTLIPELR